MKFALNTPVGTPDHGDGIVFGENPANGKVVVRVNVQQVVPPGQKKIESCNGWQYEYDPSVLTPPEGRLKR